MTQKVKDLEVLSKKKKDMYIPPHKHQRMKKQEGGQIEKVLFLILYKIKEHDRVLEEITENVLMLNQMTTSDAMFIKPLESQMNQLLSCLYLQHKEGLPSGC